MFGININFLKVVMAVISYKDVHTGLNIRLKLPEPLHVWTIKFHFILIKRAILDLAD